MWLNFIQRARREYERALPFLNILSEDKAYGKVDENENERFQEKIRELETELDRRDSALSRVEKSLQQVIERLKRLEDEKTLQ